MSELIAAYKNRDIRRKFLTSVSALALTVYVSAPSFAADSDKPQVWIELGGQLSGLSGAEEPLVPHFADVAMQHGLPLQLAPLEAGPKHSLDAEGSISLQPKGSSWIFSASVRYGRSNARRQQYQQLDPVNYHTPNWGISQYPHGPGRGEPHGTQEGHVTFGAVPIVDYRAQKNESHAILDFQAGKDVGLGLFGRGTSEIAVGVRFAQLTSKTKLTLYGDPYPHMSGKKYFPPLHASLYTNTYDQYYKALPRMARSFHGVGPTLSWSGSEPVINVDDDTDIAFDWGINAGILFGRQKARVEHQTSGTTWYYHLFPTAEQGTYGSSHYANNAHIVRSRNVTIPNLGGVAGLSLQFPNAKVSIGYRADFFFGAMDGGIDARHAKDVGFHGLFATISIGLGG